MSIRTTVTLDDDVVERVKEASRAHGVPFRDMLNDLLRLALVQQDAKPKSRKFKIRPVSMGFRAGLNDDDVESLLDRGEGERRR